MNTVLRSWSLVLLFFLVSAGPAIAFKRYGPFELTGNIAGQQLFRHSDIDEWAFVQQRNTLKLRFDYNMYDKGVLFGALPVPFIERANLLALYRGVYDSVYDYTPGFEQEDIYGYDVGLNNRLNDLPNRDDIKFDNDLREFYVDLRFKHIPVSLRLGRQQIVWGETDNFRLLDRTNALDLSWHLQQESWDELRIPYWMIKGLYDIGRIGPLSDTFIEAYYNPGDWYPNKRKFLPRPWSLPITNPLDQAQATTGLQGLYNDTRLFQQGDYKRNPDDNSQVGVRFNAYTPQGIQFTLNYFYQRWSGGDDGTNAAAFRGLVDPREANDAFARNELPIVAIFPYVNCFGVSANYSDEEWTGAVFRMETIYEINVPFLDASKQFDTANVTRYDNPLAAAILARDVYGISKHDMWKGSLAFDRPTWIRFLNRRATFLILGQFFWHYLLDNPTPRCNDANEGLPCADSGQGRGLRGALSASEISTTALIGSRGINATPQAFFDRVRTWEVLTTLAATTFYKGGSIIPLLVYVLDPMNSFNMEVLWSVDWYITPNFIANIGQRYFINTTDRPVFETWGVQAPTAGDPKRSYG